MLWLRKIGIGRWQDWYSRDQSLVMQLLVPPGVCCWNDDDNQTPFPWASTVTNGSAKAESQLCGWRDPFPWTDPSLRGRASSKEFWRGGGADVSLGEIGCHNHRLFSYFLVKYVYLLCELNYNASNSQEIASLSLHYSSGGVKTTFSTVMRTLLAPRSATILTPLRGLQPPQLTC